MRKKSPGKENDKAEQVDLEALVIELLQQFDTSIEGYLWPWEEARWYELVYCLALQLRPSDLSNDEIHRAIASLGDLGLLSPEALSEFNAEGNDDPDLQLMNNVLERYGMSSEESSALVVTICEAAKGFTSQYQGKVQRFLRKYGQMMLEELISTISLSKMDEKDAKMAFSQWLQNAAGMPLVLSSEDLEELCSGLETTSTEFVDVVDGLNLNLTMVDDFVFSFLETEQQLAEDEEIE